MNYENLSIADLVAIIIHSEKNIDALSLQGEKPGITPEKAEEIAKKMSKYYTLSIEAEREYNIRMETGIIV